MLCSFRSVHVCNKSVLSVVTKRGMSNAKYQWNNFGVKLKKHPTTNNEDQNKKEMLDSFIRVDHAGEVGAKKIYEGQLAALKGNFVQPIIQDMADAEIKHLKTFEKLIRQNKVRPTVLFPLWNVVGFGAGYVSGLLGKEAAMAVTVAVEEVIGEHYNSQLRDMIENGYTKEEQDLRLKNIFRDFRDEELGHLETGLQHDAQKIPFYDAFTQVIKAGTTTAIWLSSRI